MDQLLANLCVNARDAIANTGSGKVTIETENAAIDEAYCAQQVEARPGRYVILAVSDNGCGMDRETLDHIFEPFFTTKGIGKGTGNRTGHGLRNRQAERGFHQRVQRTGARRDFPASTCRAPRGSLRGNRPPRRRHQAPAGPETILLVEDEQSLRVTISRNLQRLGYTVLAAASPAACGGGAAGGIALLLTDVVMPGMSGRELAGQLACGTTRR